MAEISFVGCRQGLESRVVPERGYQIRYIAIRGFLGKGLAEKLQFPFYMAWATVQSLLLFLGHRPDAVLGTGGYVSAPPVLAAGILGIPVGLLALDAMPSQAVRTMARFAREIYAGFPECADHIKPRDKVAFTGNPLREDLGRHTKAEGRLEFGLSPDKQTVLVFGGSQGAHSINMAMAKAIAAQGGRWSGLQFIFQTGKNDFETVNIMLASSPVTTVVLPYIEKMALAFAASDLVVSRSGSTVSEILACGLPSILVPFPHAASNHQEHNARSLERAGAAMVILDRELNERTLAQAIDEILSNDSVRLQISERSQNIARPEAQQYIAQRLLKLIRS